MTYGIYNDGVLTEVRSPRTEEGRGKRAEMRPRDVAVSPPCLPDCIIPWRLSPLRRGFLLEATIYFSKLKESAMSGKINTHNLRKYKTHKTLTLKREKLTVLNIRLDIDINS